MPEIYLNIMTTLDGAEGVGNSKAFEVRPVVGRSVCFLNVIATIPELGMDQKTKNKKCFFF
jgi:hypothetical protein